MLTRIIIGIIMIAVGVIMIIKTESFMGIFGRIAWAEAKLGSGGTRSFYKLLGIAIIFLAFMIMNGGIFGALDMVFKR